MKIVEIILDSASIFIRKVEKISMSLSIIVLIAMMLLVGFGVLMRYVFNNPVHGVEEISESAIVFITYFMLAQIQSERRHLSVQIFVIKQSDKTKKILSIINDCFALAIFIIIAFASWNFAKEALITGARSEDLGFPLFPIRLFMPVGALLMCFQLAIDIARETFNSMKIKTLKR